MKNFTEIEEYILAKPNAWLDHPFGDDVAVYKVGAKGNSKNGGGKLFAIMPIKKNEFLPPSISLKCEPELAEHLRVKYTSVMPGYHLNKKHWNTIVVAGEMSDDELKDLIDLSYKLVVEG